MEWFEYCLPLKKPLPLPGGLSLTERRGILLHDPQSGGWGDAAPLPGFSRESFEEVRSEVQGGELNRSDFPSVRFATWCLEQPWTPPTETVHCNGLWILSTESVQKIDARIREWPNPVLKVKPGKDPDVRSLLDLLERRPELRYRLDGNRQWSVETTLNLATHLPETSLEYIEEPLQEPEGYEELWRRAPVPVALDECLLEEGGRELADAEQVAALILKPSLLGGAKDWRPWLDLSRDRGKSIIWSSSFESGVGLWHLASLASGGGHAGLDTGDWFQRDLVSPRPLSRNGVFPPAEGLEVHSAFLRPKT